MTDQEAIECALYVMSGVHSMNPYAITDRLDELTRDDAVLVVRAAGFVMHQFLVDREANLNPPDDVAGYHASLGADLDYYLTSEWAQWAAQQWVLSRGVSGI